MQINSFLKRQKNLTIIFLFCFFLLLIFFLLFKNVSLIVDEQMHYQQIKFFLNSNFAINPSLAVMPGYHSLLALLVVIFSLSSMAFFRFISLLFALGLIILFYLLAKKINCQGLSAIKILQLLLLPIMFPFCLLIYTDIASLFFVLLTFYLLLINKPKSSAITGSISLLIRQNNIVWLLFIIIFHYLSQSQGRLNKASVIKFIKSHWIFFLNFILFAIFIIANKGVAIGDKTMHPTLYFGFNNIFFILFLFFFIFFPLNVYNFPKIAKLLKTNKKIILYIAIFFLVYLVSFNITHPYNTTSLFFVKNIILKFFASSVYLKILFFIPITYSILSLITTRLAKKSFYLLYPVTILFLMIIWLVEVRYYFVPLAFFILFKQEKILLLEYLTIIIYLITSCLLSWGIYHNYFFL